MFHNSDKYAFIEDGAAITIPVIKNLIELNPEKQTEIINRLKSLDQKLFDEVAKRMGLATIGTTTATRGILD